MVNYFWLYKQGIIDIPSDQGANFVSAIVGFVAGAVVMVVVSLFTAPKPAEALAGPGLRHDVPRHGGAARRGRRRLVPQAGPAGLGRDRPRRRLLHPLLVLTTLRDWEPCPSRTATHERDVQREVAELEAKSATAAARLFDLRRIIGGLFVVYGVIVTIAGITASDADLKKAAGHQHQPVDRPRACSPSGSSSWSG